MQVPLVSAEIGDRHALAAALTAYGSAALTTLTNPYVLAMYRLAIAEAPGNTELGEILDASGRAPNRRMLVELVQRGQAAGFLGAGEPLDIAREFFSLLIGDLMVWLLVGVNEPPASASEIRTRAERATPAVLALHPRPRSVDERRAVETRQRQPEIADQRRRDVDQAARLAAHARRCGRHSPSGTAASRRAPSRHAGRCRPAPACLRTPPSACRERRSGWRRAGAPC